jgi:hypothetical protein
MIDRSGAACLIAGCARRYKRSMSGDGAAIMIGARDWRDGADGIARSGPVGFAHDHRNDGGRRRGHDVSQKKGLGWHGARGRMAIRRMTPPQSGQQAASQWIGA